MPIDVGTGIGKNKRKHQILRGFVARTPWTLSFEITCD